MHDIFFQNLLKTFVAIDPVSLIPIFAVITASLKKEKIIKFSFYVFIISSFVLTFFSFFGNNFLIFMGISIQSFQIIGGIFLLFISYEMVFEKRIERKKNLTNEIIDETQLNNLAVFPVSIPLVAGPSAITLSVLISKNYENTFVSFYEKILPILIILLLTSLIIIFSNYISRKLNVTVIKVLQKIFGLLLGALSVEFVINGIKDSI